MRSFCFLVIILSLILSVSTPAFSLTYLQSGKISGIYITPAEFSQLPKYLQERVKYYYKQSGPEYQQWAKKFGSDYQHYHHWAVGQVKFRRAMTQSDLQQRKYYLRRVLAEYNYLLRHCLPDNGLRYLFHYKKAEALVALNDLRSAISELTASLNYKNNFVPTYLLLSESYSRLGMQQQSDEVLELMRQRTGK